jgi:CxxC motif-containing protein (DUF1111 family)
MVAPACIAVAVGVAVGGCRNDSGSGEPAAAAASSGSVTPAVSADELGLPRSDLTPEQLAAFNRGKLLFTSKLPKFGPLYNDQACAECHANPTIGGSGSPEHAAFMGPGGTDVEVYRRHALPGWTVPTFPPDVSRRLAPPLYGLGLIEQIPDSTIRAACGQGHVDLSKLQGSLPHNEVARFGIKPFLGTVPDFVGSALLSESSVTTAVEGGGDDDEYPDPEVGPEFVESLAAFVRGLRPPGRNGSNPAGEAAFHSFGCAGCHVPDMPPANGVFSDFCLHAMGQELADGIIDHEARGDEFRTTPLWGLRFKTHYLHDGRTTDLDAAITAHGGEAAGAVRAYSHASDEDRAALLAFLRTL